MCVCVCICVREVETGSAPRGNRSPYLIWGGGGGYRLLDTGAPLTLCVRVWGGLGGVLPTLAALAGLLCVMLCCCSFVCAHTVEGGGGGRLCLPSLLLPALNICLCHLAVLCHCFTPLIVF